VYCEVGQTTKLTTERREYILYDKVTNELADYFSHHPDPDYITFSGSGEPTLNSRIGDVLQFIKKNKPTIPVAVLTNGTLFYDKNVRDELLEANVVLPSLDAAREDTFRKINRPTQGLDVKKYIKGLADFRREYSGKIWLEVFFAPGYNDSEADLIALKNAFEQIMPDQIQLNTLDRPGTVNNVQRASMEYLERVIDFWQLPNVEIIAAAPERKYIQSYRKDAEMAILETIARRPCTVDDLVKILGQHTNEINKYLDVLEAEGKVEPVRQERGIFYQIKNK
jgi:wyosine [tRNA(Phe)-imidazoG37] synthetase (radical SAM superfamily)